jgi:hypothetical protein
MEVENGWVCEECQEEYYFECEDCGSVHPIDDARVIDGKELCGNCASNYTECDDCGDMHHRDDCGSYRVYDNGIMQLCDSCRSDNYTECDDCDILVRDDDIEDDLCPSCREHQEGEKGTLHSWNHRPKLNFCGEGNRFLGVELEVRNPHASYDEQSVLIKDIVRGEETHYCKEDSSIGGGFEIVSHPATLEKHLNTFGWDDIIGKCKAEAYKSHTGGKCGLHVHVSREAFGDNEDEQDKILGRLLFFFSKFSSELAKLSRRDSERLNEWASFTRTNADNAEYDVKSLKSSGRYYAINLSNKHTVEFRLWRGTLKYNTFVATLQITDALVDIGLNETLYDIDYHTFQYFTKKYFNTPEIKKYFEERGM